MSGALHDRHDIASGDPQTLRDEAAALRTVTDNIDVVARLLRSVSTHGVWDSAAGETFADEVGAVPGDLDLVSARLHDAAVLLGPYADQLEDSQRRMRDLDDRYVDAARTRDERDEELAALPADHPDRPRLTSERGEAARRATLAADDFEVASDAAIDDERRLAGRLSDVCLDLADPKGYDSLEGLTDVGAAARGTPIGWIVKPVAVAGTAEAVGLTGRKVVYDEGSWKEVGRASVGTLAEVVDLGAIRAITWARRSATPPTKGAGSVNPGRAARSPAGKAFGNPIAARRLRDVEGARTTLGRAAQSAKHDTADLLSRKVREKTGVAQLEQFEDDWAAVAGSRLRSGVVVSGHSARHAARVAGNVGTGHRQLEAHVLEDDSTTQQRARTPGPVPSR